MLVKSGNLEQLLSNSQQNCICVWFQRTLVLGYPLVDSNAWWRSISNKNLHPIDFKTYIRVVLQLQETSSTNGGGNCHMDCIFLKTISKNQGCFKLQVPCSPSWTIMLKLLVWIENIIRMTTTEYFSEELPSTDLIIFCPTVVDVKIYHMTRLNLFFRFPNRLRDTGKKRYSFVIINQYILIEP